MPAAKYEGVVLDDCIWSEESIKEDIWRATRGAVPLGELLRLGEVREVGRDGGRRLVVETPNWVCAVEIRPAAPRGCHYYVKCERK
jgi:hypothetical protein